MKTGFCALSEHTKCPGHVEELYSLVAKAIRAAAPRAPRADVLEKP